MIKQKVQIYTIVAAFFQISVQYFLIYSILNIIMKRSINVQEQTCNMTRKGKLWFLLGLYTF